MKRVPGKYSCCYCHYISLVFIWYRYFSTATLDYVMPLKNLLLGPSKYVLYTTDTMPVTQTTMPTADFTRMFCCLWMTYKKPVTLAWKYQQKKLTHVTLVALLTNLTNPYYVCKQNHVDTSRKQDPSAQLYLCGTCTNYTVSQIKRGHFSFRYNFYSC